MVALLLGLALLVSSGALRTPEALTSTSAAPSPPAAWTPVTSGSLTGAHLLTLEAPSRGWAQEAVRARAAVDTLSIPSRPRSLLQGDQLPVSYANFSQPALLQTVEDLVAERIADLGGTLLLAPLHTADLRDPVTGAKVSVPAFIPAEPDKALSGAYLAPSDLAAITSALGPSSAARGISASNPVASVATQGSVVNIAGLAREDAQGAIAMPTLFSPHHMSFALEVTNSSVVTMEAFTLWLPDFRGPITGSTAREELPMFQLDAGSRVCFVNSTLVVYDCEENSGFQAICWTQAGVAAFRSITDPGALNITRLHEIDCISTRPRDAQGDGATSESLGAGGIIAIAAALLLLCCCVTGAALLLTRSRRRQKEERARVTGEQITSTLAPSQAAHGNSLQSEVPEAL